MLTFNSHRWPTPLRRVLVMALAVAALGLVGFAVVRLSPPQLAAVRAPVPDPVIDPLVMAPTRPDQEIAVFAGGCFWGMEALFEHVKGVSSVISGYAGGSAETANYPQVSHGQTEHAESIKITFDPSQISYGQLLKIFLTVAHDPTQLNQQGFDVGKQYRSAIFPTNPQQEEMAQAYIAQLNQAKIFYQPVVTQVEPFTGFYPAEDYHQEFVSRHPSNFYVMAVEKPKIKRFQQRFPDLYASPNLKIN